MQIPDLKLPDKEACELAYSLQTAQFSDLGRAYSAVLEQELRTCASAPQPEDPIFNDQLALVTERVNQGMETLRGHIVQKMQDVILANNGVIPCWPGEYLDDASLVLMVHKKVVSYPFSFFGADFEVKDGQVRRKTSALQPRHYEVTYPSDGDPEYDQMRLKENLLRAEIRQSTQDIPKRSLKKRLTDALYTVGFFAGVLICLYFLVVFLTMFFTQGDASAFEVNGISNQSALYGVWNLLTGIPYLVYEIVSYLGKYSNGAYWIGSIIAVLVFLGGIAFCGYALRALVRARTARKNAGKQHRAAEKALQTFLNSQEYLTCVAQHKAQKEKYSRIALQWQEAWYQWACEAQGL